ncbi:tetratricopeptide repeat protein 5 isoform X3 [Heptranchias perlo]|uniref:tetratricopeptide repeat protein 5 isoform X3 n=1 Tax=Heptranchias perlo TaxID=212740 RepID=UPI00355A2313
MAAEEERDGDRRVRELVDELYVFRDHYFECHGVEEAGRKQRDLTERMTRTLSEIAALEGSSRNKAQLLMLEGKALNVVADYSPKAEEALSKAVKLDPGLVEAWNQLGEVYWKKGDIAAAKTCFSGALNHCKNKVSLRNLSMVLRQVRAQGDDHSKNVFASVEQAKLAVQMDVKDGTSWYILGNAYLSLFFVTGQSPRICQQALSAYAQAEKVDLAARSNPDLHLNRSTGKLKAKKLHNLMASLQNKDLSMYKGRTYTTASGQNISLDLKPLSTLLPGANTGTVVLGKVVFSLTDEEKVPFTFGLVDAEGTCLPVMVYNIVESWGMLIGDSVAIPEPLLKEHSVEQKGKSFSFSSIRVETPLVLVVNGKKQSVNSQAAAIVAYKPQTE